MYSTYTTVAEVLYEDRGRTLEGIGRYDSPDMVGLGHYPSPNITAGVIGLYVTSAIIGRKPKLM